jgi:hypothetical protein
VSLAFSLAPGASRRVAVLVSLSHGCAALGLAAAALRLAAAGQHGASGLLLAFLVPVLLCWRRALLRCGASGCLTVDEAGRATWSFRPGGGGSGEPVEPLRWHVFAGVAWIELGAAGGRRLSLLSGADRASDREWRGLMRWLRWLDRGA